jgi:hypothetical protein
MTTNRHIRSRGQVLVRLGAALAVSGGAGVAAWNFSDYRVERVDGVLCGVGPDRFTLGRGESLASGFKDSRGACEALLARPVAECPSISPSASKTCAPYRPAGYVEPMLMRVAVDVPNPWRDTSLLAFAKRTMTILARGVGMTGNWEHYPATVFMTTAPSCLGTMVGDHAVLTAAHCVPPDLAPQFQHICLGVTSSFSVNCTTPLDYPGKAACASELVDGCEFDVAVCKPVRSIACRGRRFERVSLSVPSMLWVVGNADNINPHEGKPTKFTMKSGPSPADRMITIDDITLDEGDSGGAAFDQKAPERRRVTAVNSRGGDPSRLVSLSSVGQFLMNGPAAICGIAPASGVVPNAGCP